MEGPTETAAAAAVASIPTTPVAAAAAMTPDETDTLQVPPAVSLLPAEETNSMLLRDWTSHPNGTATASAADMSPVPPVAPAIVLSETSGDSTSSGARRVSSIPVATFVSNFVRTSVNELRDHLGSQIYASAIPEDGAATATADDVLMTTRSAPIIAPATSTRPAETASANFATARSLNVMNDESSEFVLVDGDLVVPPRPSAIDQEEMDVLRHRANCRTSRMRRGVKRIKKWVKKKRKSGHPNPRILSVPSDRSELESMVGSTDEISTQFSSSQATSSRRDDESIATTSTAVASDSPSRRGMVKFGKKKKNRLARLMDSESSSSRDRGFPPISASSSLIGPPAESVSVPDALAPAAAPASVAQAEMPPTQSSNPSLGLPNPSAFGLNRQGSIAAEASFVGNLDQPYLEAGVVTAEAYIEDRLDDYDKYDKKDDGYPYLRSMVPRDADFKVDKQEAPCVDSMLQRAGEFAEDLEASEQDHLLTPPPAKLLKGKSDGGSVPLSMATSQDSLVHNDMLKLVMVGAPTVDKSGLARALRKSHKKKSRKRTTLGVDVHAWTPPNTENVKFTIWDVQGNSDAAASRSTSSGSSGSDSSYSLANFGAHPGTQSLFFSDRSLYLLVWDLAARNRKTYHRASCDDSDEEDDEEDENEYLREEANRQADRALQTDIEERVLSWVACVARRGSHSAILPIALVPVDMSPDEAKRRCDAMQTLLMEYTERMLGTDDLIPPKVLSGAETVLCVSLDTNMGMDLLEETILAIATDASHSVFEHVATPVPPGTVQVLETIKRLKTDHKLVLVDHLMAELPGDTVLSVDDVLGALHFLSSIGELLYFGGTDEILSHYVILSRKWLVSALSCILRNDLKRELSETRRFMNMQCLYSDQRFLENHVTQTFSTSSSSCPLLSSSDTRMLWQSMSFMREAADRSSQLSENSTTASTMFGFLEHLLVHSGVLMPLDIDRFASPDNVYFVPSLLAQADSRDVWTFKSSESWKTTLSHSWLFRDGAPAGLIEQVTVSLLRDLYEFSHVVAARPLSSTPTRSNTFPLAHNSLTNFIDSHDGEAIGHIKIHQIMCWKNSLLVKIGCVFPEGSELRESFVEIFVAIADQASPHCVASDAMRANMQRLIVSGKGHVGHHGRKLWKGGYGIVLDSIKASVALCTNVDRQVVCPECLAHAHPKNASTWSWDSVRSAAESGSSIVRCMRGHRVDSNLICGTSKPALPKSELGHHLTEVPKKPVRELLSSVVVVGLWDAKTKTLRRIGSGFIADKKLGLIVTASHTLFDMEEGIHFGNPYLGLKQGRAVIGVIPDGESRDTAVFRYFAEIVAEDIHNMDACVLKITARLEHDVDDDTQIGEQPETFFTNMGKEQLASLKMTRRFEIEETVRILGFNQGGEGILEQGKHVNRSADFAKGYICKQFKMSDDHSTSSSNDDSSSSGSGFSPREEIVVICPNIVGHSGGPCVNDEGKVVGILSRADPVDRQRCYLVPSSELKMLVNKARKSSSRGGLKRF